MPNQDLTNFLRNLLRDYGMDDEEIARAVRGELKEAWIAKAYPEIVARITEDRDNFATTFDAGVAAVGGIWTDSMWNLTGVHLTGPLRFVATEECTAISTYGRTAGFDAAKAITNLLRMIKVGASP